MRLTKAVVVSVLGGVLCLHLAHAQLTSKDGTVLSLLAEAHELPPANPDPITSRFATFWTVIDGRVLAPQPGFPNGPLTQYRFFQFDNGAFLVEDLKHPVSVANLSRLNAEIDEVLYMKEQARQTELARQVGETMGVNLVEMDLFSSGGSLGMSALYGPNDLWLEILSLDLTSQYANLRLHGTEEGRSYQLLSTNCLGSNGEWTLGDIGYGEYQSNKLDFLNVYVGTNTQMFFRAHQADPIVSVSATAPIAVEPYGSDPGQDGVFQVSVSATNDVTVFYRLSGTATNGVDYTNLTGSVVILANTGSAEVRISPLSDTLIEGRETVTLTVVQTNDYLIQPYVDSATVEILDSSQTIQVYLGDDSIEPNGPPSVPAHIGYIWFQRSDERNLYSDLDVFYRISGTASNGVDYTLLSGIFHFESGMTAGNLDIVPLSDNIIEGFEKVIITLVPTNSYLIDTNNAQATNTIKDSTTTIFIYPATVNPAIESNGPPGIPARISQFQVSRNDARSPAQYPEMDVYYRVSGTASNGMDYALLTGVLHFLTNSTLTNLDIIPLGDNVIEGTENLTVTLIATNGYYVTADTNYGSASVSIIDSSMTVQIENFSLPLTVSQAIEADGPPGTPARAASLLVSRYDSLRPNTYSEMDVYYRLSGTASNGADYVLSGILHFATNIYSTNLDIVPLADSIIEGTETVTVTLFATNGYYVNTNKASAGVTISDSSTTVKIAPILDATEPSPGSTFAGVTGWFEITRTDFRNAFSNDLVISYAVTGGTATAGVDYTNLPGTVRMLAGQTKTNIYIQPLPDDLLEGDETVIISLIATNGYYTTNAALSATRSIHDNFSTNIFEPVVTNLPGLVGIDYHGPTSSLIVSYNYANYNSGEPFNFARVYTALIGGTNFTLTTNWSGVHGLGDEIKLVTAKATANGFTNGDMFFSSGTGVGWLSADSTRSNLNWCSLTNSTFVNTLPIRGSLCFDTTGIFSNHIIVVTSPSSALPGNKTVWRVSGQGVPTLLATIYTPHLEGVIVVPNDTSKWGPLAGKILTGDEDTGMIYLIDSGGNVTATNSASLFGASIGSEDFDFVPANQALYCINENLNHVEKVSPSVITNNVGDLLITQSGDSSPARIPTLFFVRWNVTNSTFQVKSISRENIQAFEHVTFAPIDIPKQ